MSLQSSFNHPPAGPIGSLRKLVTHPMIKDWATLAAMGAMAEGTRRLTLWGFNKASKELYLTSTHNGLDESYEWLMNFWVRDEEWTKKARDFTYQSHHISVQNQLSWHPSVDKDEDDKKPRLQPRSGTTHWIKHGGTWFEFSYVKESDEAIGGAYAPPKLVVSAIIRSHAPLFSLLNEARLLYQKQDRNNLLIYSVCETRATWKRLATRKKRSIHTVFIDDNIIETLLNDMREFLGGASWYARRGLPWRRGYLLHGEPGTGKTSTIHALASYLDLPVYMIPLSSSCLTDTVLLETMIQVPARAIVVMEDVDVAMHNRENETKNDGSDRKSSQADDHETSTNGGLFEKTDKDDDSAKAKITLSGLLNAIDGLAGAEGRILFMTTNYKDRLDTALIRPGRADVHCEYMLATQKQAEAMFRNFYPTRLDNSELIGEAALNLDNHGVASWVNRIWEKKEIEILAQQWRKGVPEREFSAAALQGLLLLHKANPEHAVVGLPKWIAASRQKAQQTRGHKFYGNVPIEIEEKKEGTPGKEE